MKGGAKVVVEPHRHEGVFIARGKEDALCTLNSAPGKVGAAEIGLQPWTCLYFCGVSALCVLVFRALLQRWSCTTHYLQIVLSRVHECFVPGIYFRTGHPAYILVLIKRFPFGMWLT